MDWFLCDTNLRHQRVKIQGKLRSNEVFHADNTSNNIKD